MCRDLQRTRGCIWKNISSEGCKKHSQSSTMKRHLKACVFGEIPPKSWNHSSPKNRVTTADLEMCLAHHQNQNNRHRNILVLHVVHQLRPVPMWFGGTLHAQHPSYYQAPKTNASWHVIKMIPHFDTWLLPHLDLWFDRG